MGLSVIHLRTYEVPHLIVFVLINLHSKAKHFGTIWTKVNLHNNLQITKLRKNFDDCISLVKYPNNLYCVVKKLFFYRISQLKTTLFQQLPFFSLSILSLVFGVFLLIAQYMSCLFLNSTLPGNTYMLLFLILKGFTILNVSVAIPNCFICICESGLLGFLLRSR